MYYLCTSFLATPVATIFDLIPLPTQFPRLPVFEGFATLDADLGFLWFCHDCACNMTFPKSVVRDQVTVQPASARSLTASASLYSVSGWLIPKVS